MKPKIDQREGRHIIQTRIWMDHKCGVAYLNASMCDPMTQIITRTGDTGGRETTASYLNGFSPKVAFESINTTCEKIQFLAALLSCPQDLTEDLSTVHTHDSLATGAWPKMAA